MKRKILPIGEVLKKIFLDLEKRQEISEDRMSRLWKNLVGESGFRHSKPVSLKKRILTVRVDNSVWMQDLVMRKRRLLKGLKRELGKDKICEIHFRIGELNGQNSSER